MGIHIYTTILSQSFRISFFYVLLDDLERKRMLKAAYKSINISKDSVMDSDR